MTLRQGLFLLVACLGCADPVGEEALEIGGGPFVDPACADGSLQIFDETNFVGHRICFTSLGTADLRAHCRIQGISGCVSTWVGQTRSYRSGQYGGRFGTDAQPDCFYPYDAYPGTSPGRFVPGQNKRVADACAQGARYVSLTSMSGPPF